MREDYEDYILVIPARLDSTRLSKKLLIEIEGKSIIERTYNQALKALKNKDKIIIATDSLIIKKHCEIFGAKTLLTSKDCLTGTDRIAEVSEKIPAGQYINLQGDEPIFPSDQLEIFIIQLFLILKRMLKTQIKFVNMFKRDYL